MKQKHAVLQAFSEKPFLLLWIGEVCTQFAINLLNFYLILYIFKLTKSSTAVSIIVLSYTLPAIFLGVIAGAYVDRWNKKTVLLATNIIRAILLVFLALFHKNIFIIYLVSFLIGITTQFFIPAESPLIPLVVKKESLFSANALFGLALFGSILLAYIFSSPFVLFEGFVRTLFILATFFMAGALFISFITVQSVNEEALDKPVKKIQISVLKEIRHTFSVISQKKDVFHAVMLLALSQILVFLFAVVIPGYANDILHIGVEDIPLLLATPAALGVVVGALILGNFFHNVKKQHLVTLGIFLSSLAMFTMPFAPIIASREVVNDINRIMPPFLDITRVHILMFLSFLLGIANGMVFVPSNTILQEGTADEFRGKIYGVLNTVVGVFSLLPIILAGSLADILGVGRVIIGIGVTLFILAVSRLVFRI